MNSRLDDVGVPGRVDASEAIQTFVDNIGAQSWSSTSSSDSERAAAVSATIPPYFKMAKEAEDEFFVVNREPIHSRLDDVGVPGRVDASEAIQTFVDNIGAQS